MLLHPKQKTIVQSNARFKVIRAGRKAGKTALEVENLCFKAIVSSKNLGLSKTDFKTGRKVIYIAPTQDQARKIVWEALKSRLADVGKPNEQQLTMRVPNEDGEETTIFIGGWENRENYRGLADVIHITFDEVDTLRDFFIAWKEIFRPMFLDTKGTADFIGTPKKESGNLRRLEKQAQESPEEWECFHFTSKDNPFIPQSELDAIEKEYKDDRVSYRQEILAEYIDHTGSLFNYSALLDVFTNTVVKGKKYLIVDIANEGADTSVFSFWNGLEEYRREIFSGLNNEGVILKIKEFAMVEQIPYSHIIVDAVGVGSGVASSSSLNGIVGFKGSFSPIKTDINIVKVPDVGYLPDSTVLTSDYKNLRTQCVFTLADHINNHKIASKVGGELREKLIEEVFCYQDTSTGDGKRMCTQTEEIKQMIGRSPDNASTWIMRMYFVIMEKMIPGQSETTARAIEIQRMNFDRNFRRQEMNSSK